MASPRSADSLPVRQPPRLGQPGVGRYGADHLLRGVLPLRQHGVSGGATAHAEVSRSGIGTRARSGMRRVGYTRGEVLRAVVGEVDSGGSIGIAAGLNSFEYCHCSPTRFIDDNGRDPVPAAPHSPSGLGALGQPPLIFRLIEGAKNLEISHAEVELPPTAMAVLGASYGAVQSLIPSGLGSRIPSPAQKSKAFETNRGYVQTWIGAAQTYIGLTEAGGGGAAAPETAGISALAIPAGLAVTATGVVNLSAGGVTIARQLHFHQTVRRRLPQALGHQIQFHPGGLRNLPSPLTENKQPRQLLLRWHLHLKPSLKSYKLWVHPLEHKPLTC